MISLEDFKEARAQGKKSKPFKSGFSPWSVTNKGEDNDGFIRFYNGKRQMSMEPFKQLAYLNKGKYKLLEGDSDIRYLPFSFDKPEDAKNAANMFTFFNIYDGVPFFDTHRYTTFTRCRDLIDLDDHYRLQDLSKWCSDELCRERDTTPMTSYESGEMMKQFYEDFVEER